jgi:hypothetical protein
VAIEWQPGRIDWFVDGVNYHTATPADVAPNQGVFDHPFFLLLLNVAAGGNFGGPVGADTVFPASLLVDYVRVCRGPDTSERFRASFTDDFSGWQEGGRRRAGSRPQSCGAVASDVNAAEPQLGPLAPNGGPTGTHLPQPGSPAFDRAPTCPATDQRRGGPFRGTTG